MEKFFASELDEMIRESTKKLKVNFFYSLFIFFVFSFFFYYKNKNVDVVFIVCEALFIVTLSMIQILQVSFKSKIISRTAVEIVIDADEVQIITPSFSYLFFNKKSERISFKKNSFSITKASYGLKEIYDIKSYVYQLSHRHESVYIIDDYFDQSLMPSLQSMAKA